MNTRRAILGGLLAGALLAAARAAAPLPGDSLFQLSVGLTLADGTAMPFAGLRGKPTVITMFYASCDGVCPTIAFSMRRMENALTPAQRAGLQWVMVSFDPARDDAAALRRFATDNKLDTGQWRLARAPEAGVRDLAAALNIKYREISAGVFSHSAELVLLDAQGVIRARTANLITLDTDFMRAVQRELAQR